MWEFTVSRVTLQDKVKEVFVHNEQNSKIESFSIERNIEHWKWCKEDILISLLALKGNELMQN